MIKNQISGKTQINYFLPSLESTDKYHPQPGLLGACSEPTQWNDHDHHDSPENWRVFFTTNNDIEEFLLFLL